jgi:uncharacterized protein
MKKDSIELGKSDESSISVDVNKLVDSRMLIQGNSGGGKSYLLRVLCERAAAHVPIIILDSEGEFASLREKIDALLIGPEGDVPTDIRSAALLARKLVELRISAIVDLYELKPHERRQFVKLFLEALIDLPRSLWHPTLIVIDECHKFAPEKGQGDAVSTQAVIDLMSLGRKRGFAGVLATQRFSKLHNDAIAETNNVFIGRTWMDADQKRAGEYLGLQASDRRLLRDLKQGEFYAFGPALSIGGVFKFKGNKAETSHPKPGERHKIKPPKASDAVKQIVSQIEDLPEVAEVEAKNLAAAKQKIRELERELKQRPVEKVAETVEVIKEVEVPIVPEGMLDKAQELVEALDGRIASLTGIRDDFTTHVSLAAKLTDRVPINHQVQAVPRSEPPKRTPLPIRSSGYDPEKGSLPEGEQKILTAIAQYSDRGGADREQISILTGYKRSTRDAYIQRLGTKVLVEIQGGKLFATADGISALGNFEPLPTGQALQQYWLERLPQGEAAILRVLLDNYPATVARDHISDVTGFKRSTRDAYIQRLGVKKLVSSNSGGVGASENLFG